MGNYDINLFPIKIISGDYTLSLNQDDKVILDDDSGDPHTLTLPKGANGRFFGIAPSFATLDNGTVWTLAATGTDTLDGTLSTITEPIGVIYFNGVWYSCV